VRVAAAASSEQAGENGNRLSRILRTVRWFELLSIIVGEGLLEIINRNPLSSTEARSVLLVAGLIFAFNLWAGMSGHVHLIDRSTAVGIAIDLAFFTLVVMSTGGAQSRFLGLYAVLVVCVAVQFGLHGALLAAASAAILTAVAEVLSSGGTPDLEYDVIWRGVYLFLLAWVAGEMTEAFHDEADRRSSSESARERMEGDLEAARHVQLNLLPSALPEVPGLEVAVRYEPAGAVGGDIYDFLFYGADEVGFVVADVSGHGLPAALLVSAATSAVHDAAPHPPAQMMNHLNARMLSAAGPDQFLTFVCARLNACTGKGWVINGGHPPAVIIRRNGRTESVPGGGTVVGITRDASWAEHFISLNKGDVLVLYSDGLMERRTSDGLFVGLDEWLQAISSVRPVGDLDAIAQKLWERSQALGRSDDDASLVVVRFSGQRT
jgi:serine phosphatase RsbU (regulator of sigma subunit)